MAAQLPRFSPLMAAARVLLLLCLALLGYYAFLYLVQRRLLYPAPHGAPVVPRDAEPVTFSTASGPARAFFLPAASPGPGPAAAIVFLHGNAEQAEDWLTMFGPARKAGIAVLVAEYPGYGASPGNPSETSLTDAGLGAYDWLSRRADIDSARIVAYGRSLGGGVATRLATRRHVAALVLESTFTSLRAFAARFWAPAFLVRDPFESLAELARYRGPLLVLHGEHDEVAPFAQGRVLAGAVAGSVFIPMDCGHNDCDRPWPSVLAFLRSHGIGFSPTNPGKG